MKKYPGIQGMHLALRASVLLTFLWMSPAHARIGEGRASLERRLNASGGIVYRDDVIEANRRRGMPYLRYLDFLPGSAEVRIYFKTADGRRPTSSELEERRMAEGWDLHVVYVNGQSVIEVYKRSQAITEFELNHLLALHAGGSYWKKVDKEAKEAAVSAFGFDMIREDGQVRAKKLGGDSVIFVDTEFDIKLATSHTGALQDRAPLSVDGF